ncbi:MAG: hypothetical protein WB392_07500 [Methanotrichaceae archaeon]
MSYNGPDLIGDLQAFLEDLEEHSPTRQDVAGTRVAYRQLRPDEIIDDSLPSEEIFEEEIIEEDRSEEVEIPDILEFRSSKTCPIVAIDCGIARLGETENGLVIALRSAMVVNHGDDAQVNFFRTGPIYLHNQYKRYALYQMGKHLNRPDLFVELEETESGDIRPTVIKNGVADNVHQYSDRFRNWLERLVQRIAVRSIENGIILFDGALTLRTRDTSDNYLYDLAKLASDKGNAIIGISKQSILQVQGRSVQFWLDDSPSRPCYRELMSLMSRERSDRVLGNIYAARFSPLGPTFRMDVKAAEGQADNEAIKLFYSSALMRGGYPDILVRAHAYSYFTSPDVIQLQAQASAKYSLLSQSGIDLRGIFAPFGGRFK